MKKELVDGFLWVRFHEHPIVDYKKQSAKLFDVTSEGYKRFSSDFISNGEFDHNQYCICLLETAFRLRAHQLSSFLDYQCMQLEVPYRWLIQFDTLLNNNAKHQLIKPFLEKLNSLILLLEDKRNEYSNYVQEQQMIFKSAIMKESDKRFDIVKVKAELSDKEAFQAKKFFLLRRRTDYLQEVEDNEKAPFIKGLDMELDFLESTTGLDIRGHEFKRMTFRGTPSQLADIMWQIKELRDKDGNLIFEGSTRGYARFICNCFCKLDGSPFVETSIRKFLTRYNKGERLLEKNRIDISGIKLKDD